MTITADEIVDLIDVMTAAWPWAEWTPNQTGLWCTALGDLDRNDATVAVAKAVKQLDRPPSIAWVLAEARNEAERRPRPAAVELEPPADPGGRARFLAAAREALERNRGRVHDHHGGWRSCVICREHPPTVRTGNPKDDD